MQLHSLFSARATAGRARDRWFGAGEVEQAPQHSPGSGPLQGRNNMIAIKREPLSGGLLKLPTAALARRKTTCGKSILTAAAAISPTSGTPVHQKSATPARMPSPNIVEESGGQRPMCETSMPDTFPGSALTGRAITLGPGGPQVRSPIQFANAQQATPACGSRQHTFEFSARRPGIARCWLVLTPHAARRRGEHPVNAGSPDLKPTRDFGKIYTLSVKLSDLLSNPLLPISVRYRLDRRRPRPCENGWSQGVERAAGVFGADRRSSHVAAAVVTGTARACALRFRLGRDVPWAKA